METKIKNTFLTLSLMISLIFAWPVLASINEGTVDATDKYAWSENAGWINFGTSEGNVRITDSGLTGYAWGENIGWISLNCSNDSSCATVDYKVANDENGNLSGYAWGENVGWVNFNPDHGGVSIGATGEFSGYAWGENVGWIVFNCANTNSCATVDYKVKTDYLPKSARPSASAPSLDVSSADAHPSDAPSLGARPLDLIIEKIPEPLKPKIPFISKPQPQPREETPQPEKPSGGEKPKKPFLERIPEVLKPFIPEILKPEEPSKPEVVPLEELVPREAPLSMQGKWQLLPVEPIHEFVFAPLPQEIGNLVQKFPELQETFHNLGITKLTDLDKLKEVKITLPGLGQEAGAGREFVPNIPVAQLPLEAKEKLPTEIVFARGGGELIDLNTILSLNAKNQVEEKITTIAGKPLNLAVKPDKPVKMVRGYVVFKSRNIGMSSSEPKTDQSMKLKDLLSSTISAAPALAQKVEQPSQYIALEGFQTRDLAEFKTVASAPQILGSTFPAESVNPQETRLVLQEFEYTDPDNDGIYTAEITSPKVDGGYEIITVMDYQDPELASKEIKLICVVDPEGYVYEKAGNKEIRIPEAVVSLYWQNPETENYELWPAKDFQQENPQTTDNTGKYSFLVPQGSYYLKVEAAGYKVYEGKPFDVQEGSGVHSNIEIKSKYSWLKVFDWKIILLIIVILLLSYNFYRDKIREKHKTFNQ